MKKRKKVWEILNILQKEKSTKLKILETCEELYSDKTLIRDSTILL